MRYRRLGGTGLLLSEISLGTWATVGQALDDAGSLALLDEAYQLGVNFIDNAETYGDGAAEAATGRVLARLRWPRETIVLSGKVFWGTHDGRPNTNGLGRKHIVEGCHATLRRLGVEHLDLFLCHRPDPDTPLAETVAAMSDLVRQGKILYWGTSEWQAATHEQAHALAVELGGYRPVVEQPQYNLLVRARVEREYAHLPVGLTTWSPLAYGLLSGGYDAGVQPTSRLGRAGYGWLRSSALGADEPATLARVRRYTALARELGVEPAALAIAWVLRNPAVTSAICGASSPAQLRANVAALDLGDILDDELCARIDDALRTPEPAAGGDAGPRRAGVGPAAVGGTRSDGVPCD
jgi:voltage-dependent potassium channel beta subunit